MHPHFEVVQIDILFGQKKYLVLSGKMNCMFSFSTFPGRNTLPRLTMPCISPCCVTVLELFCSLLDVNIHIQRSFQNWKTGVYGRKSISKTFYVRLLCSVTYLSGPIVSTFKLHMFIFRITYRTFTDCGKIIIEKKKIAVNHKLVKQFNKYV